MANFNLIFCATQGQGQRIGAHYANRDPLHHEGERSIVRSHKQKPLLMLVLVDLDLTVILGHKPNLTPLAQSPGCFVFNLSTFRQGIHEIETIPVLDWLVTPSHNPQYVASVIPTYSLPCVFVAVLRRKRDSSTITDQRLR